MRDHPGVGWCTVPTSTQTCVCEIVPHHFNNNVYIQRDKVIRSKGDDELKVLCDAMPHVHGQTMTYYDFMGTMHKVPGRGKWRLHKAQPWFETATYREGHVEVLQSRTREPEGMKPAAKTYNRHTF